MSAQPLVETVIGLLGVSSAALCALMMADWYKASRQARVQSEPRTSTSQQGDALSA